MALITLLEQTFTISAGGNGRIPFPIDVTGGAEATIQVDLHSGGYGTGKLVVQRSSNGLFFIDFTTPIQFKADGFAVFSVDDTRFIDVVETVAMSAGTRLTVTVLVRGES